MTKASTRTMDESLSLFEEMKLFFLKKEKPQIVIEISDRPMAEWSIIKINSHEEMFDVRSDLSDRQIDFGGFIDFEGDCNFYFVDQNIMKSQNINSGEVTHFTDFTFQPYDLSLLVKELRETQGS